MKTFARPIYTNDNGRFHWSAAVFKAGKIPKGWTRLQIANVNSPFNFDTFSGARGNAKRVLGELGIGMKQSRAALDKALLGRRS